MSKCIHTVHLCVFGLWMCDAACECTAVCRIVNIFVDAVKFFNIIDTNVFVVSMNILRYFLILEASSHLRCQITVRNQLVWSGKAQ